MCRNFAEFPSERKVRNLFAKIREFRGISAKFALISFARYCITNISIIEVVFHVFAGETAHYSVKKAGKRQNLFGCKN